MLSAKTLKQPLGPPASSWEASGGKGERLRSHHQGPRVDVLGWFVFVGHRGCGSLVVAGFGGASPSPDRVMSGGGAAAQAALCLSLPRPRGASGSLLMRHPPTLAQLLLWAPRPQPAGFLKRTRSK